MPSSSRFRVARRVTFTGAGTVILYTPAAGEVLNVRQLTVSTEDAAELVVFFGSTAGDRLNDARAIRGAFLAANAGAAPDLGCLGAWSPSAGLPVMLYASAACDAWVALEGTAED